MANQDAVAALRAGTTAWQSFRSQALSKAVLTEADLRWADLRWANLPAANLQGANLQGANLTGANLVDANLHGANMSGIDLSDANLIRANLTEANLSESKLTRANLTGANLSGANLSGADLTKTNMFKSALIRTNLDRTNLAEANLSGAYLTLAHLVDANLNQVSLDRAKLDRADLTRANLSGATLAKSDLINANLTGAKLTRASLVGALWDPQFPPIWPDGFDPPHNAYKRSPLAPLATSPVLRISVDVGADTSPPHLSESVANLVDVAALVEALLPVFAEPNSNRDEFIPSFVVHSMRYENPLATDLAFVLPPEAAIAAGVTGVATAAMRHQEQLRRTVDWIVGRKENWAAQKAEAQATEARARADQALHKLEEARATRALEDLLQASATPLNALPPRAASTLLQVVNDDIKMDPLVREQE